MLNRFLIVVLAILNVGVALWWMAPRAPEPSPPEPAETGVARLELVVPEALPATAAVAAPPAAEAADPPAAADSAAERCLSLGPFADKARAQAAVATLGADLLRSHLREVPPRAASSYRVILPPAATREEAQATAKRIADAGFGDYFIMGQGEEANAIALGQYRSREGAERRQATLVEAGFPAQLLTSGGEEASSWWLDAAHAGTVPAAALQRRSGAQRQQVLDCARLR
ncbi:hypothetical protein ABB34_06275 [Stenotrophomonas daejeonensis]|uniref:SPOR domain-containing protein n=1 Tax=Stenotrophomonas daejeonensis TaxID=659018 RepID=A0A0R0E9A9_9GAMM|nr:SPOR domain-containing protein [Stenotrophomonas daejeonensis]KRG86756.1 hypothetical protein ABB34_06275 [Stenotrophomonas daejeonensis]